MCNLLNIHCKGNVTEHERPEETSRQRYLQASSCHCQNAPLPPVLQRQNRVPGSAHFSLTSHTEHDRKPLNGPLYNEIHSKAPPHWTTHFLDELAQRVRSVCVCLKYSFYLKNLLFVFGTVYRLWSFMFDPPQLRDHPTVRVVSDPISEMQDQYRGQLAACAPLGEHYSKIQVR